MNAVLAIEVLLLSLLAPTVSGGDIQYPSHRAASPNKPISIVQTQTPAKNGKNPANLKEVENKLLAYLHGSKGRVQRQVALADDLLSRYEVEPDSPQVLIRAREYCLNSEKMRLLQTFAQENGITTRQVKDMILTQRDNSEVRKVIAELRVMIDELSEKDRELEAVGFQCQ